MRRRKGKTKGATPSRLNPNTARYGNSLALWLNQSRRTSTHRRVCNLIALFRAVRESISGYDHQVERRLEDGRLFSGKMANEVLSGDCECTRRISKLRKKLRQYRFFPDVECPLERQWIGSWEPTRRRGVRRHAGRSDVVRHHAGEHDAVRWLHEISTTDGGLERLRQCACGCNLWFFALKLDRDYYGKHRQKNYRNSAAFKKGRAKYMREYRRREKDKAEKALKNARRELRART